MKLLLALGGLGTYAGHVVGAALCPGKSYKPFGLVPVGVWVLGGAIFFGGTAAVMLLVRWVVGPSN